MNARVSYVPIANDAKYLDDIPGSTVADNLKEVFNGGNYTDIIDLDLSTDGRELTVMSIMAGENANHTNPYKELLAALSITGRLRVEFEY